MPRKSKAELSVVSPVVVIPRPAAPDELTDEQAAVWEGLVSSLPGEWFPQATHGLLTQYCRHVIAANRINQIIERDEGFDVDHFDKLLKMQERESRAIASLATRMRISQQSLYDKSKRRKPAGPRPWEAIK